VKLDFHTRDDSELHSNAHTTPVGSYAHLAISKKNDQAQQRKHSPKSKSKIVGTV
jgi:hypothetical protein